MFHRVRLSRPRAVLITFTLILTLLLSACTTAPSSPATPTPSPPSPAKELPKGPITVYSGRNEELIGPVFDAFTNATGIELSVKYGATAQLAATLLEEGTRSPADVYLAQDAGALGQLVTSGLFNPLPTEILNRVEPRFRAQNGEWVGLTGRARVVVYNTDKINPADLPVTIWGFTDPSWKGRIGWPPTNGSFQAFVTALRLVEGEARAKEWLEAMMKNQPVVFKNNTSAVEGVAKGEVDVAFVNHYYLYQFLKEQGDGFKARNHVLTGGDVGAMINVSGAGILKTSKNQAAAAKLLEFLLSEEAQKMYAEGNKEYPLIKGVPASFDLTPLDQIKTPALNLSDLDKLDETLKLLRDVGAL